MSRHHLVMHSQARCSSPIKSGASAAVANSVMGWVEALPHETRRAAIKQLATLQSLTLDDALTKYDASFSARKSLELASDVAVAMRASFRAAALASSAHGPGLEASIVRHLGVFTITTCDESGKRRTQGGDSLTVAIRGNSNVRARVIDNQDGTYTCKYRAWVSGVYSIAIWLAGELLGRSPYTMHVLSTRADASKCELRGGGLTSALSREPASFEIEFVDAFGRVCYAEELDVYAEPEPVAATAATSSEYCRISAVERQRHIDLWARRLATDLSVLVLPHSRKKGKEATEREMANETEQQAYLKAAAASAASFSFHDEPKVDGIGFAYGGVSPGILHAHGQLLRVHKVQYSIGLAGVYRLHVGLRQQSVPLPGSPFRLEVAPGRAYAPSTRLPKEQLPLQAVAGDKWREIVVFTADKIGNRCVTGGAKVSINVDCVNVQTNCIDNANGSYRLQWRSQRSGTFSVSITIDDVPVAGSPTTVSIIPAILVVGKCEAAGSGLSRAVAGETALLRVTVKDKYANRATPSKSLRFALKLQQEASSDAKEKRKNRGDAGSEASSRRKTAAKPKDSEARARNRKAFESLPPMPSEGGWVDGEYEIRYVAQRAGNHLLHLWADPVGKGHLEPLPGSPFSVHVVEAKASPLYLS